MPESGEQIGSRAFLPGSSTSGSAASQGAFLAVTAHPVPSIVSHHPSQSVGVDDGQANSLDVTVVLPCYNEQDHVRDEIERIATAMDASDFSYELLSHRRQVDRQHARGAT